MSDGKVICPRCKQRTDVTIMSRFNTQEICIACEKRERQHPDYQRAAEAELAAVRRGDYNFPGVGCPQELLDVLPATNSEAASF